MKNRIPSWDNLQVGDIIVDADGEEIKVLVILGDVFLASHRNEFDESGCWYTKKEAKSLGHKLKVNTPKEIVVKGKRYREVE